MKILLMTILISTGLFAKESDQPLTKETLKAHYQNIDMKAQKLKTVPDDELLADILVECYKAKKIDVNLFCLDSVKEFYMHFPQTVTRVSESQFDKKDSEFILRRLEILREETILGNDPSVEN
tara:strand:+ start:503 stop:871 length:369 start_codon:yes stop_codon:yes gene_type:complete